MVKIADLPRGWYLCVDPAAPDPLFVNRDGLRCTAWEMVSTGHEDEARAVLEAVKKMFRDEFEPIRKRAFERAKYGLELSLAPEVGSR
jgi:hypothetical protein